MRRSRENRKSEPISRRELSTSSRRRILSLGSSSCRSRRSRSRDRNFLLLLALCRLLRWRIPIIYHLNSQYSIERKARNEPIQDQLIIHFLKSCKYSREGTGEVVEDLYHTISKSPILRGQKRSLTANALNCPVPPS